MSKLVIANWKMNPATYDEAEDLAEKVCNFVAESNCENVVICPPFPWLAGLSQKYSGKVFFGAQDVFWEDKGAYTGEVSPLMLKSVNVRYVLVGHSERRALGETDEMIGKKISAALKNGLTVLLCVGEPKEVRGQGIEAAKKFVKEQLMKVLKTGADEKEPQVIIAYEPVWAISSGSGGVSDSPQEAEEMAVFIKDFVFSNFKFKPKVIYGGSVDDKNAAGFLGLGAIDGVLVGGASLRADDFTEIIRAANN